MDQILTLFIPDPRVARLRARLGFTIQIIVAILAGALWLYFKLFSILGMPCPSAIGHACEWLVFPNDNSFTTSQVAFLVIVIWIALAFLIYFLSSRTLACLSLRKIYQTIDSLIYEQQFESVIKFVEPYMTLVNHASRRQLPIQRLHDYFSAMRGLRTTNETLNEIKVGIDHEAQFSPLIKQLRSVAGSLAVVIPAQNQARDSALRIASTLFSSVVFRKYIVKNRPYFAISLFQLDMHEKYDFAEVYIGELISDNGSVLYHELQQNQEVNYFPEANRLLHFLFTDVNMARRLEVWRPIGNHITKLFQQGTPSEYIASLNRRSNEFDDNEYWKDPVWAGIFFFDLMIRAAIQQDIQNHMWLFYLQYFVEGLEEIYDTSDQKVNPDDEFPTKGARLIYDAMGTLCSWLRLTNELPDRSPHRQFSRYQSVSNVELQRWDYDPDINDNIPLCAAVAVGTCMATVVMSNRIEDKFKIYLYKVVLNTVKSIRKDGEDGDLRKFLIYAIINGGNNAIEPHYGRRLVNLFSKVDFVLQSHVDDYENALREYSTFKLSKRNHDMNDKTIHSDDHPEEIIKELVQEGMEARASYQVWAALRKKEFFDQYEEILTNSDYYDFFSASSTAHFKLIFLSLGKIFDSGRRPASIENLKRSLEKANRKELVTYIEKNLGDQIEIREKIKAIRNKAIAHTQLYMSAGEPYKTNQVTPDELCCFIDETCKVINHLAQEFNLNGMFMSDRVKRSTLKVLGELKAT